MTSTRISSEVSSSSIDNEKQIKTVLNVVLVLLMVASLLMAVKNGILWFNEKASIMSVIVPLGLLVLFSLVWGMIPSNKDKTKKKKPAEQESTVATAPTTTTSDSTSQSGEKTDIKPISNRRKLADRVYDLEDAYTVKIREVDKIDNELHTAEVERKEYEEEIQRALGRRLHHD